MQSPGVGRAEAGGPKEGADLAGWRNNRKTSVSGEVLGKNGVRSGAKDSDRPGHIRP